MTNIYRPHHLVFAAAKAENPFIQQPRGITPRGERGNENATVSVSTVGTACPSGATNCAFVTLSEVEGSHSVTVKKRGFFDFAQNDNPRIDKKAAAQKD